MVIVGLCLIFLTYRWVLSLARVRRARLDEERRDRKDAATRYHRFRPVDVNPGFLRSYLEAVTATGQSQPLSFWISLGVLLGVSQVASVILDPTHWVRFSGTAAWWSCSSRLCLARGMTGVGEPPRLALYSPS